MSMQVVSAYITELRLARGMSGMDVALEARRLFPHLRKKSMNQNYVGRLEKWSGKTSPKFDLVVVVTLALGGNMGHVAELLRNEALTVEYAKRLARAWVKLTGSDQEEIDALYQDMGPDQVLRAVEEDAATDAVLPVRGFFAWWHARKRGRPQ